MSALLGTSRCRARMSFNRVKRIDYRNPISAYEIRYTCQRFEGWASPSYEHTHAANDLHAPRPFLSLKPHSVLSLDLAQAIDTSVDLHPL